MKVLSILLAVTTLCVAQQIVIQTNTVSHHHHHHKHQHTKTLHINVPKITEFAKRADTSTTGDKLPPAPAMPTLSTSTVYNVDVQVPEVKNPYTQNSSLPEGIVFIIVGAIIGLVFVSFAAYGIIDWLISYRRSKLDREIYYHNLANGGASFGGSLFGGNSTSSNSSMFEKNSSYLSNSSFYQLSRNNSLAQLDEMITTSSQQGRTYRDAVQGNIYKNGNNSASKLASNRGSMFISPVLETISGRRSLSQLELPLYNQQPAIPLGDQSVMMGSSISSPTSNILSPYTAHNGDQGSRDSLNINDFDYLEAEGLLRNNDNSDVESAIEMRPIQNSHHSYAQLISNSKLDQNSTSELQSQSQSQSQPKQQEKRKSRPPSLYLDDLLNDQ
ncbi:uncharacterized protein RJT21DRAFT_118882 [Scheffersomyces amazonensis]|uniref:uncharacterized protein n=1 Tax=Scheffersomyces amazonensis TaxID=1078765 RepID=UPI00315C5892